MANPTTPTAATTTAKETRLTIGLDIGDRKTHLCVLDHVTGEVLEEGSFKTTEEVLRKRLGNYEHALALAERVNLPGYFSDPFCRAIIHARLGNEDDAAKALDEFQALWPNATLQHFREEHLVKWFYANPELIDQIMVGMRMAGLE